MNLFTKRKIFTFTILLITLISCKHYIFISRSPWQSKPVVPDGKPREWTLPLRYYDDKSKLQFAFSNDSKNLYFCIRATEQETQSKMLRAGFQLWIDTTGKNEQTVGILFPLSISLRKMSTDDAEKKPKEKPDVSSYINTFNNGYKEMELAGFKPTMNGIKPIKTDFGINVNINWDSTHILTYEGVVPFSTFYKDSITPKDSLKLIGISLVLNGLKMPESSHSSGDAGGGGMRGGGGGGHGGGHGGGGGGHGGGGNTVRTEGSQYLYESETIKKIFQLCGQEEKQDPKEYYKQ